MVEALQLRRNALNGLLNVFKATFVQARKHRGDQGRYRAFRADVRGVASDVIWEDMFVVAARDVLKNRASPASRRRPRSSLPIPQRATSNSMEVVWQRFHGVQSSTNTSGAIHGTNIAYVKVTPSEKTLT